jgi:septation ring formation regulator EzrA
VNRPIKDYYSNCYGIRVIDETEVAAFFEALTGAIPSAENCVDSTLANIEKVVFDKHKFTKKYLGLEESFYEIVSSISAIGLSINNPRVVNMFGDIIERKSTLSSDLGAWDQYTHLARWLIYLATILDVKATSIEEIYLKAVRQSMESMSNELRLGYSWQSYKAWRAKWDSITPANRALIKDYITDHSTWNDALSIVNLG